MLLHALSALAIPLLAHAADHQVVVGGAAGLVFDPQSITAAAGDTVSFSFRQKNHTVTQSSFSNPCLTVAGGWDSGFVPVADTQTTDFPVHQLTINDTNPLWFYCKQGAHCRQGMVFAVNPGDRFDTWKAAAMAGTSPSQPPSASAPQPTATAPVPSTSAGSNHKVVVGGSAGLVFAPASITAQAGDTITFEFQQKNHTVTQSTFDNPCASNGGFDSGFRPVADAETANFPTYTLKINDTKPIWAYCAQGAHCKAGMVFAVNAAASGSNTFDAFRTKAMGGTPSSAPSPSPSSRNSAVGLNTPWWIGVVSVAIGAVFV